MFSERVSLLRNSLAGSACICDLFPANIEDGRFYPLRLSIVSVSSYIFLLCLGVLVCLSLVDV